VAADILIEVTRADAHGATHAHGSDIAALDQLVGVGAADVENGCNLAAIE
jgi:hypothetical protein